MPIVAFVLFDLVAVMFLLWCLLNFVREGARHRGVDVKVMRLDPMQARRKANIFSPAEARVFPPGTPRSHHAVRAFNGEHARTQD